MSVIVLICSPINSNKHSCKSNFTEEAWRPALGDLLSREVPENAGDRS
jgi:hypothetical protein